MSEKQLDFYSSRIAHHSSLLFLRFLLDLYYCAAFIKSALGAHAMWHARLLTVGADRGLRRAQRIVRAALARSCF
jgi:hypothetical protein